MFTNPADAEAFRAANEKFLQSCSHCVPPFGVPPVGDVDPDQWLGGDPRPRVAPKKPEEPKPLTPEEEEALQRKTHEDAQAGARLLLEYSSSAYLGPIVQPAFAGNLTPLAIQRYRTTYLKLAGASSDDPIHVAMVESFLLLHHVIGKLLSMSSDMQNATSIPIIGSTAVKFLAEQRRLAVAIKAIRSPANAADAANNSPPQSGKSEKSSRRKTRKKRPVVRKDAPKNEFGTELRSNGATNGVKTTLKAQPAASCRRTKEPCVAPRIDRRGSGTLAAKRA